MLINPPPGYSPSAVNRQNVRNVPGQQGLEAQGYFSSAPAGTMLPSSYLPPPGASSLPNSGMPNSSAPPGGAAPVTQAAYGAPPSPRQDQSLGSPLGGRGAPYGQDVAGVLRALTRNG